jgi:probable rRNA maturation factor
MAIQFFFLQHNFTLTRRNALKQFIAKVFKDEKRQLAGLSYIFCSDEYLLNINKTHLKHNYYTDIITFNLSDTSDTITGEIYISIDRVRDNAAKLGVTIQEELHRVIFHGALHLCGYKDKTPNHQKAMRAAEDKLLGTYQRST